LFLSAEVLCLSDRNQILALERLIADIGPILGQLLDVLEEHENRLQLVEQQHPKLPVDLRRIVVEIGKLQDPVKKAVALFEFDLLCRALGFDEEEF
jgi:hypothetical protein